VSPKIVLKVGFLERDFERDHLAEKKNRTKMGQKIHCVYWEKSVRGVIDFGPCHLHFKTTPF
jgi:hypothetical protein